MSLRATSKRLCAGVMASVLASALWFALAGCDMLRQPPVPDWPGPHAPYPFPDNVPHRTE